MYIEVIFSKRRNFFVSRIILVLISIVFLISGCSYDDQVVFFRGDKRSAGKIVTLCDAYKLPVEFVSQNRQVSVLRGPKDLRFVYSRLMLEIDPYLASADKKSEFKAFFIPRKFGKNLKEQGEPTQIDIFEKIGKASFILSANSESSIKLGEDPILTLFYVNHPSIEMQVDSFSEELNQISPKLKIIKHPVALDLTISPRLESSGLSISVFEPFSFHVLNSERNLAGMQLLVLLLLFLLSGFILGLWWKGKN